MKLLLDEHFSPDIADSLRRRGHDVVAVAERVELRGLVDPDILDIAATEHRVVVTGDVGDFARLGGRRLRNLKPHVGVVLVPRRSFPGSADAFGRLIRALDALLLAHPGDDDLTDDVVWLKPADEGGAKGR